MTWLDYVDLAIVGVFITDFILAARRAGGFRRILAERWWELPSMIPITGGMVAGLDGISLVRGVRLLRLEQGDLLQLMNEQPAIGIAMCQTLSGRVRDLINRIEGRVPKQEDSEPKPHRS